MKKNLALIGPPGSGKGSYGRHIAKFYDIPLLTMSDVLRQNKPDVDLNSGELIDDQTVGAALLSSLTSQQSNNGYLLDGFPRTLDQIHVMNETWPQHLRLKGVLQLNVPDRVCSKKLLGRRFCLLCKTNFSINGVNFDNFCLPPSQPQYCEHFCNPGEHWQIRQDDTPEIVVSRLKTYHQHMDPISSYFESQQKLLKLTPYNGYDDIPVLVKTIDQWMRILKNKL
jgi:adenylate kinase